MRSKKTLRASFRIQKQGRAVTWRKKFSSMGRGVSSSRDRRRHRIRSLDARRDDDSFGILPLLRLRSVRDANHSNARRRALLCRTILHMLRRLVTIPTQRNKIAQFKSQRWTVFKCDDVMNLCRNCELVLLQAFLTEIMITLQRHQSESAPRSLMVEALLLVGFLVPVSFVGRMIAAPHFPYLSRQETFRHPS